MDESKVPEDAIDKSGPNWKVKSTFIDDAIKIFAKNFCEDKEFIPLDGSISKSQQTFAAGAPGSLKPHQEIYESRNYTKEEIEEIIKKDSEKLGYADHVYGANPCKKDRMVDSGCPLLSNLDKLWTNIGEVFTEYKQANTDTLLQLLKSKMPKLDIAWEAGGNLKVNGATTAISYDNVKAAFTGLTKIASEKVANQLIASVICKKIKKLF